MPFRQHAQTQKRIRYKPLRKNGHQRAITKDRSRYFYVPLKESAETILLPKVEDGNYVLLFGPELRPSQHIWKKQKNCWRTSTVAYRKCTFLFCIILKKKKVRNFWPDYISHFTGRPSRRVCASRKTLSGIPSAVRWLRITSTSNYEAFRAQEILPILSKMTQCLETSKWFSSSMSSTSSTAPPEVTDSMLDVLRGIKQTKQNYRLHVRSLLCRWKKKNSFVTLTVFSSFCLVSSSGRHVQHPWVDRKKLVTF